MNNRLFKNTLSFAQSFDCHDELAKYRSKFNIPIDASGNKVIYLCGNSLGLMPKQTKTYLNQELDDWAKYGVQGHFLAKNPWFSYHEQLSPPMAKIVGALSSEVVIMNSLTTNLHILMASFYKPKGKKRKIMMEYNPFPSDRYAMSSQVRFHGGDTMTDIIELKPTTNEYVDPNSVLDQIQKNKDSIALILIGAVNYYTGQSYNISEITKLAKKYDIIVGLDLAHAAGNIELKLHDDEVDFAAWCSYKYLNSGPGSLAGIFIHEKHHNKNQNSRLEGWWGHNKSRRFLMEKSFIGIPTAEAWQHSNPPILSMAAIKSSLQIFQEAGFDNLVAKSKLLTAYMEYLLTENLESQIDILTPSIEKERGAQLSIIIKGKTKTFHQKLTKKGIICDWREPSCIRIAPVPLYNTFEDVFQFVEQLKRLLH